MTSVSVLTSAGRGAVTTVRVRGDIGLIDGPPPLFRAINRQAISDLPIGRVTLGGWSDVSAETDAMPTEEVVVCRTADKMLEIHCHGGKAAASRIVSDLESRGCRVSSLSTIAQAAVCETGESVVVDRECVVALSRATTLRTADILLQQQDGLLRKTFEQLRHLKPDDTKRQVDELLKWGNFGVHLTEPWRIVLCGRPNAGKSSLINALVGFSRSIVFDQPGTTRDVVTAETAMEGWPVMISDTAGLREEADELEAKGIERARQQVQEADLRVMLVDVSEAPHPDDRCHLETWPDTVLVAHKCDLPKVRDHETLPDAIAVSSLTGVGVVQLAEEIIRRLLPTVPDPMTPVPVTQRQVRLLQEIRQIIDEEVPGDVVQRRIRELYWG